MAERAKNTTKIDVKYLMSLFDRTGGSNKKPAPAAQKAVVAEKVVAPVRAATGPARNVNIRTFDDIQQEMQRIETNLSKYESYDKHKHIVFEEDLCKIIKAIHTYTTENSFATKINSEKLVNRLQGIFLKLSKRLPASERKISTSSESTTPTTTYVVQEEVVLRPRVAEAAPPPMQRNVSRLSLGVGRDEKIASVSNLRNIFEEKIKQNIGLGVITNPKPPNPLIRSKSAMNLPPTGYYIKYSELLKSAGSSKSKSSIDVHSKPLEDSTEDEECSSDESGSANLVDESRKQAGKIFYDANGTSTDLGDVKQNSHVEKEVFTVVEASNVVQEIAVEKPIFRVIEEDVVETGDVIVEEPIDNKPIFKALKDIVQKLNEASVERAASEEHLQENFEDAENTDEIQDEELYYEIEQNSSPIYQVIDDAAAGGQIDDILKRSKADEDLEQNFDGITDENLNINDLSRVENAVKNIDVAFDEILERSKADGDLEQNFDRITDENLMNINEDLSRLDDAFDEMFDKF